MFPYDARCTFSIVINIDITNLLFDKNLLIICIFVTIKQMVFLIKIAKWCLKLRNFQQILPFFVTNFTILAYMVSMLWTNLEHQIFLSFWKHWFDRRIFPKKTFLKNFYHNGAQRHGKLWTFLVCKIWLISKIIS